MPLERQQGLDERDVNAFDKPVEHLHSRYLQNLQDRAVRSGVVSDISFAGPEEGIENVVGHDAIYLEGADSHRNVLSRRLHGKPQSSTPVRACHSRRTHPKIPPPKS
jgi:hypothetical protein